MPRRSRADRARSRTGSASRWPARCDQRRGPRAASWLIGLASRSVLSRFGSQGTGASLWPAPARWRAGAAKLSLPRRGRSARRRRHAPRRAPARRAVGRPRSAARGWRAGAAASSAIAAGTPQSRSMIASTWPPLASWSSARESSSSDRIRMVLSAPSSSARLSPSRFLPAAIIRVGAQKPRGLHGDAADRASRPEHEHGFPTRKLAAPLKRQPRRQAGVPKRGGDRGVNPVGNLDHRALRRASARQRRRTERPSRRSRPGGHPRADRPRRSRPRTEAVAA